MRQFCILIIGSLLFSCLKFPESEYPLHQNNTGEFAKCVVFFNDLTSIEFLLNDATYSYSIFTMGDTEMFTMSKNDQILLATEVVYTELTPHCNGADCYYTQEFISHENDTIHVIIDPSIEYRLIGEYPLNMENIGSYLPDDKSISDIYTLWNYFQ